MSRPAQLALALIEGVAFVLLITGLFYAGAILNLALNAPQP